jgi:hypothetical protein
VVTERHNLAIPGEWPASKTAGITSGKKLIGGALFYHMRGTYGMRHQSHATNNSLLVAHHDMRHAYGEYWWRI